MSAFTVERARPLSSNMVELTLQTKEPLRTVRAGQFVHIAPGGFRLRRPISIMDADEGEGRLILGISPKGEGTRMICALEPGASLDLLGPMGKGFSPGEGEVWIVGGGIGVAPLILAAKRYKATRAFFGFQSAPMAYGVAAAEGYGARVSVATDDGTLGARGFVTTLLEEALREGTPGTLLVCGPLPMMGAVKRLAQAFGVRAQVSMEQRMACGVGACLVCACAAESGGYLRVCRDGPVFDAEEVRL